MARLVPLDNVEHADLRLAGGPEEASVNQALVGPSEFEAVQREYPILFRRGDDGEFQALAILGLDRGENLFLADGELNGHYVPAAFRRGPLFLASEDDSAPLGLMIDLDDPRVGETEGEPLFLPHGGAAPALQRATDALQIIKQGLDLSQSMFAMFLDLGLVAPVEIDVDLGDGTHYRLADFFNISPDALRDLGGKQLERLNRSGFLACAIHARSSLGNVNRVIERKVRKLASADRG